MKTAFTAIALAVGALALASGAQAQEKVKIGFVTDMSSLYADIEGKNGARAHCDDADCGCDEAEFLFVHAVVSLKDG